MDSNENKNVVRRFVNEAINERREDVLPELFATGFVDHLPFPGLPPGIEGFKALAAGIYKAFPDAKVTIDDLIAEGDRVAERATARATHLGDFNGIPPTGRKVSWTEQHLYRFRDGKIVEHWADVDIAGLMAQIGAPVPPR